MKQLDVKWNQAELVKILKNSTDSNCIQMLVKQKLDEYGVSIALKEGINVEYLAQKMTLDQLKTWLDQTHDKRKIQQIVPYVKQECIELIWNALHDGADIPQAKTELS